MQVGGAGNEGRDIREEPASVVGNTNKGLPQSAKW